MAQQKNIYSGCSKRPFSKAAASEEARRTLRYVEPLSDARTPLADFFSILLSGRSESMETSIGHRHEHCGLVNVLILIDAVQQPGEKNE